MTCLEIVYRNVADLTPNPRNSRTHSPGQVAKLRRSVETFGMNEPIGIDRNNRILAGHARWLACKAAGLATVPTVRLDHLSPEKQRAYMIAANQLATLAGWDEEMLATELQELETLDLDFALTDIGFETAELDLMLVEPGSEAKADAADELPVETGPPLSELGDLWLLGPHRLLCGDATQSASYETLMAGELAQLGLSDVPYNLEISNNVSGLGKVKHGEFPMASGEMSEAEFVRFLTAAFRLMASHSVDGAIEFIFIDWRHVYELLRAGRIVSFELKNLCVWVKANGGMGSLYRSQHELVAVFKSGTAPHANHIRLGWFGRNRTNVWNYPGMNGFQPGREELLAIHATVKPVQLLADAIRDCSHRGGIVLDPFVGSGSTILGAERVGRRCYPTITVLAKFANALEIAPGRLLD